eukprot:scaffold13.g395.t1
MAGYSGYCPSEHALPPTTKTAVNTRAPGLPNPALRGRQLPSDDLQQPTTSMYKAQFQADPAHDYGVDPRREGTWARKAAEAAASRLEPAPFCGCSVYEAELCGAGARAPASEGRGPSSPSESLAAPQIKPGYLTTNTAASLLVHQAAATAGSRALQRAGGPLPCASAARGADSPVHESTVLPRFCGTTTHQRSFAGWLTDDLNGGTVKQSCHVPGMPGAWPCPWMLHGTRACRFAGHVPRSAELAGVAAPGRRPPRELAELYGLDQHAHGRLPGYTGYKPRHGAPLDAPPPATATTQGAAAAQALSAAPLHGGRGPSHGITSATRSFFSSGSAHGAAGISGNGILAAEQFHCLVRPLEGRMRVPQASRTTRAGAKFAS